jgi:hypothetical protein
MEVKANKHNNFCVQAETEIQGQGKEKKKGLEPNEQKIPGLNITKKKKLAYTCRSCLLK